MNKKKKTKLILYFALSLVLMLIITGCKKSPVVPKDYEYDDLSVYLKLGKYKGIEYDKINTQVSRAEVQQYIDEALAESTKKEQKKEGVIENDSTVNIDYVGSLNGVEFEGGSAKDTTINISDNNFIPGFAEGLVGHKVGESFDLKVTFPDNYGNEDLAGKETVFKIKVNYIESEDSPEYNDAWVKANTDFKDTAEFEKSAKEDIAAGKKLDADSKEKQEVLGKIMDDSKVIKYPDKEYDNRYNQIVDTYKAYAENGDVEFEEYLKNDMGLTKKQFEKLAKETAQKAVKQELVLHSIAKLEKIETSSEEYNEYLSKLLKDAGYTEETYEEENGISIAEYAEKNNLYTSFLYQKVMDKVMEYSKAK